MFFIPRIKIFLFEYSIYKYIFNYILTCLSIYYPSHVIKIILKNLSIYTLLDRCEKFT